MKTIICLFFYLFTFAFYLGCGSDNPINNNPSTPPPTASDSTIKIYSPLDSSHYYEGDSIHITWSRGHGAYAYRLYFDSDASFSQNFYNVVWSDTSFSYFIGYSEPNYNYTKIVPIINDTARFQYQSETRLIYFNQ